MSTSTKTKTALTPHEKALLAGLFARTNLGMDKPKLGDVLPYRVRGPRMNKEANYADFVMTFCQEFMESDSHIETFEREAKMWWKELSKRTMSREYILEVWPDHHFLVWSEPYYLSATMAFATEHSAKNEQKRHKLSRRYKNRKGMWVVDCLMKSPITERQHAYEGGYPNFGTKDYWKAGEVL